MLPLDYNETAEVNFKLIIHGYGGHLDFNGSKQIRNGKDFVSVPMEKTWLLTLNKPAFIAKLCETHIRRLWDFNSMSRHMQLMEQTKRKKLKALNYKTFNYQFMRLLLFLKYLTCIEQCCASGRPLKTDVMKSFAQKWLMTNFLPSKNRNSLIFTIHIVFCANCINTKP